MTDFRHIAYSRYEQNIKIDYETLAAAYRRRLAGKMRMSKQWKCLDVACGYGNFLAFLRSAGLREFKGLDVSRNTINVAIKEFGDANVICSDVFEYLPKQAETYDLISALDFIEHLTKSELFEFLSLAGRAQRKGGLLLLRTPNANGLFGMAARYNDITHEVCFSPGSISDVVARFEYKTVDIWEDVGVPTSLLQTAHWLVWQSVRFAIRCVNASETGRWGDGVLTRNMWVLAEKL